MSTAVQKVAVGFGVIFVVIGILGFVLGSRTMDAKPMLGLFHVNLVHNILHLLFGIWALTSSRKEKSAETYSQIAGVVYLILALLGFFAPTGFGKVPLGDHNIWLHAVIGLTLIYFGFGASLGDEEMDDLGAL